MDALREARGLLVELRDKAVDLIKDNAKLERDLYTAAWYGSVHNVGVRFSPEADDAR